MKHLIINFLQAQSFGKNLLTTQSSSNEMADNVMSFMESFGLNETASSILGGILILVVGFFIAKFISRLVRNLIKKTGLDDKMKSSTKISTMVGKLVYFLLMIIVLMTALNIMGVGNEVLAPLNNMVQEFFSAVPNVLVAGIVIYIGYYLAKVISELVEMGGDTIQSLVPKLKLPEGIDLVKILKTIVFIFVFFPILITGLDFLNFDAITIPAKNILTDFTNSIPLIIMASVVLIVAYYGGKMLTNLLKDLLDELKVNNFSSQLGLNNIIGSTSLSKLISQLAFFIILYLAIMQALDILHLDQISNVLNEVLAVAGKVFLGLLIVVLGNIVANFAVKIFAKGEEPNFSLVIMRGAIIVIFLAMGLNAMDIADSIVNLAFGLGLGAIAVAFALSFGLGGKEAAGEQMKKFFDRFNK